MKDTGLETKATGDGVEVFDDMMRAFEAFKETNNTRLGEVERRMSADPAMLDKLERLNRRLDEMTLKQARPQLSAGTPRSGAPGRRRGGQRGVFQAAPPGRRSPWSTGSLSRDGRVRSGSLGYRGRRGRRR